MTQSASTREPVESKKGDLEYVSDSMHACVGLQRACMQMRMFGGAGMRDAGGSSADASDAFNTTRREPRRDPDVINTERSKQATRCMGMS